MELFHYTTLLLLVYIQVDLTAGLESNLMKNKNKNKIERHLSREVCTFLFHEAILDAYQSYNHRIES